MAVGRDGNPVERVIADARTALRGVTLPPRLTYDADLLARRISGRLGLLTRDPVDALVATNDEVKFEVRPSTDGRRADAAAPIAQALAVVSELDAPARVELDVPSSPSSRP